ncbi:hypothetical protein [Rubrobacter marinus]|uniref:hypothetical protein n=1 Tax=Rubrobacter marinus TaxID=2653852 RepID=UPI001D195B4F|nr:hypothetical protein [Rubrobacter marinus]
MEAPSAETPTEEFPAADTEAQPVASGAVKRNGQAAGRTNGHGVQSAETLRLTRSSRWSGGSPGSTGWTSPRSRGRAPAAG